MKPFTQYLYENTDEYRQLDELADELISELSGKTLKSYMGKAQNSLFGIEDKKDSLADEDGNPYRKHEREHSRLQDKESSRYRGIQRGNERMKYRGGQVKDKYKLGSNNDHVDRMKQNIKNIYKKPSGRK